MWWLGKKLAISQWRRAWTLKIGESISCQCGYTIAVPSYKLSPRRRFGIMDKAIDEHRKVCPIAIAKGIAD